MLPSDADPIRDLRALLAQGRYQDVLARYPVSERQREPALTLGVATAATRLGQLAAGENLAGAALGEFRARADDDGRMRTLNLLGAIMFERGRLADAGRYWAEALDIGRALGDTQLVARASNNLASALDLEGRTEVARSRYREALLAYQRMADRRGLAETCYNLAIVCRLEGDLEGAEDFGAEAVRHADVVGDAVLLALMTVGRAETMLERREFALAAEALDRAGRLAREAADELGQADVLRVRAERWLRVGEPGRALDAARAGRQIAAGHQSALLEGECAAIEARAAARLGRVDGVATARALAERIFTELGATLHLDRLRGE